MKGKYLTRLPLGLILLCASLTAGGCGNTGGFRGGASSVPYTEQDVLPDPASLGGTEQIKLGESPTPSAASSEAAGKRDNTPFVLVPEATGDEVYSNDVSAVDASNSAEGYIMARYFGANSKVKLLITGPDANTYRYDLTSDSYVSFPLTAGGGSYSVGIYENISGDSYATSMKVDINVTLNDEFRPYLYPSQYVNFKQESKTVAKAAELAQDAVSDLEVVSNIYNYVIENITYDYDKAAAPPTGYISDVDLILESGAGICLDYAAVMTSMLRSQRIPTRLEVGYAKEAYHAWISTYIKDVGWINGILEFDGKSWKLMDPTFAANSSEKSLKKFIGDGASYTVKYEY